MPPISSRAGAARRAARRRDRPDLARTIRSTAICRPAGRSSEWDERARQRPEGRRARRAKAIDGRARARDARLPPAWACRRSTTATTSARWRRRWASTDAFDFPGFVPAYIRPLFCRGIGPFRWAALSGDPEDIYKTDAKVKELIPDDTHLHNWLDMARAAHRVPGPAGAHLLGRPRRPRTASASPSTRWWRRASSRRRS